jgi:hypothetical protein
LAIAKQVIVAIDEVVGEGMIEVLRVIRIIVAACPLHLPSLDEERRPRKKLIAAAVVYVNMRIDHMRDVFRSHPETCQLADDIVADLRTDGQTWGPALAQSSDGSRDRLAVDASVKEHTPLRVDEQVTGHGDGHARAQSTVREKDVTVELQISATESIDLHHG